MFDSLRFTAMVGLATAMLAGSSASQTKELQSSHEAPSTAPLTSHSGGVLMSDTRAGATRVVAPGSALVVVGNDGGWVLYISGSPDSAYMLVAGPSPDVPEAVLASGALPPAGSLRLALPPLGEDLTPWEAEETSIFLFLGNDADDVPLRVPVVTATTAAFEPNAQTDDVLEAIAESLSAHAWDPGFVELSLTPLTSRVGSIDDLARLRDEAWALSGLQEGTQDATSDCVCETWFYCYETQEGTFCFVFVHCSGSCYFNWYYSWWFFPRAEPEPAGPAPKPSTMK